ncbi:hypothetical protein MRX96_013040 [Rhipicephalus microplus]
MSPICTLVYLCLRGDELGGGEERSHERLWVLEGSFGLAGPRRTSGAVFALAKGVAATDRGVRIASPAQLACTSACVRSCIVCSVELRCAYAAFQAAICDVDMCDGLLHSESLLPGSRGGV